MSWPTPQDYNEAIQHPPTAFVDPELRKGKPETTALGLPKPITGAFASVYEMHCGSRKWAVRCFLGECADQQERYQKISDYLRGRQLPFIVGFEYLATGIRIRNQPYPILRMEWVDGDTLDAYIRRNLRHPANLQSLAQQWVQVLAALHEAQIAHGDLQHGNILVSQGKIKLIDYDGMFVPTLHGRPSHENGHRNYQPPGRRATDFGPFLDDFSGWIILLAISALAVEPRLWQLLEAEGDECLLFRETDFRNPASSTAFRAILASSNSQLQALGKFVESLLNIPLSQMPPVTLAAGQSLPQVVSSSSSVVDWIPSQDMAKALDLLPALPELASSQTAYKDGGAWIADHIGDNPTPISVWASVRFKTERTVILGGSCAFLAITAVMLVGILPIWLAFLLLIVLIGGVSSIVYAGFQALPYIDAKSNALERVRTTKRAARIAVTAVDLLQAEFQNKLAPLAALKRQYQELPSRLQKSIEREGRQTGDLLSANQTAIQRIDAEENRTIRQIKDQLQSNTAQLGRRKAELDGQEQADVALALRPIREQSIQLEMQSRRIRDAGVRGIGAVMTSRLEGAGIRTALDVLRLNVRSVPGIGEQKAEILLYWANGVKHDAEQRAPTNLAATTRSQISDRYRTMRQKLDSQIQAYQNSADSERQSAIDKCAQQRRSFVNQRSQLEARLGDVKTAAQKQFAQERNRLENEYKNEHKRATDLQKQYETRMAGLRQAVLHEHLEVRKAENEAKRYDSLNFPEYLRRIVDIRSTLWAAKRKRP